MDYSGYYESLQKGMYDYPIKDTDQMRWARDYSYFKTLFPQMSQEILGYVVDECDQLEYEGSVMSDEFPDRVAIEQIVGRIYEKTSHLKDICTPKMPEADENLDVNAEDYYNPQGKDDWLQNLITVILCFEMYYRRRRYFQRQNR